LSPVETYPEGPRTCASVIAQTLASHGITRVFGHPGGEVLHLIDAFETSGIKFILTGHESAAAFMAGVSGRLTGTPGACLATVGPGACNLVLGVGAAYLDRDPMLAFSGVVATNRNSITSKQNLDLCSLFAPVSKLSLTLDGTSTEQTLLSAINLSRGAPRGPVFLGLPTDIARFEDRPAATPAPPEPSTANFCRNFGDISQALNAARRPIGIVGIALDPLADTATIRSFFSETGIPYLVSPQAKGIADESGQGFLGTLGTGAGDGLINAWLDGSDCCIGVGFDPVEYSSIWNLRKPFYSIANSSISFQHHWPTAECTGSVGALLGKLHAAYRGVSAWSVADVEHHRQAMAALLHPSTERTGRGLAPFHVIRTLRQALPEDTILTVDVGAHKMLACQTWRTPQAGTFLVSNGLSAMGFGVPAALAAALVHPTRPVVGIVGDGGFGMMVQELETARRIGVHPLFVVFADRSLAAIKLAQRGQNTPYRGVEFAPVDWTKVAEGFGASALTAKSLSDIGDGVQRWLGDPKLTVMTVPIDDELYVGLTY
jgi:acetolactate synthase I/II/III large subunit